MSIAVRTASLDVSIRGDQILDSIDLTVAAGEWLSIIGPNGAGKSTLLRALVGVIESHGSIELLGRPIVDYSRRERARMVSWIPQTPTIPPQMTVLDYVMLGRTPHLHPLASESAADLDIVHGVLAELELVELAGRTVETLSGGERQRAVIGRALAQQAPILLLDEPTSALDLGHQQDLLHLLELLRADGSRTVITTMHDLTLAGQFADRLLLMADGRTVAEGSAVEVLTEENLLTHYRANVQIRREGDAVLVIPNVHRPDSTRS